MKYKNVLFVGLGGSVDTFATFLAMSALREQDWSWEKCAIATPLSPFHDYDMTLHAGFICMQTITPKTKRYIPFDAHGPLASISTDDAIISRISQEAMLTCETMYGLDLRGGSEHLTKAFKTLGAWYDMVVLVDFGGESMYSGSKDVNVMSPMTKAIMLRAFVDSKIHGIVFHAGLGCDGGLHPADMKRAIGEMGSSPYPLPAVCVNKLEKLYSHYFSHVSKTDVFPFFTQLYRRHVGKETTYNTLYTKVNGIAYYTTMNHTVDSNLSHTYYLTQARKIRNPFMVRCSSPREWFAKTQIRQIHTHNEANTSYIRNGKEVWRFATPSRHFRDFIREKMMCEMIRDLRENIGLHGLWFHPADAHFISSLKLTDYFVWPEKDGMICVKRA